MYHLIVSLRLQVVPLYHVACYCSTSTATSVLFWYIMICWYTTIAKRYMGKGYMFMALFDLVGNKFAKICLICIHRCQVTRPGGAGVDFRFLGVLTRCMTWIQKLVYSSREPIGKHLHYNIYRSTSMYIYIWFPLSLYSLVSLLTLLKQYIKIWRIQ